MRNRGKTETKVSNLEKKNQLATHKTDELAKVEK